MRRIVFSTIAALGAFVAFGFGAAPARAQACGDIFDECDVADDILDFYFDQLGDFFTLDEDTCNSMAESYFKQCEKTVKSAVKCYSDVAKGLPKAAKPACKTQGQFASECNDDFKADAQDDVQDIESAGEFELGCCEDRAEDFFFTCIDGF